MLSIGRRAAIASLLVLALYLSTAVPAVAAAGGPQLAVLELAHGDGSVQETINLIDPAGRPAGTLLEARTNQIGYPNPFDHLAWSPEGRRLYFDGVLGAGGSSVFSALFALPASGGLPEQLPGETLDSGAPVVSPDGSTLAYARLHERAHAESIWLLDLATGSSRQLTPWRKGSGEAPTSFAPDGESLLATRGSRDGLQVVSVSLASGWQTVVTSGSDGAYSPDGTRIAFTRLRARYFSMGNTHGKPATSTLATVSDIFVAQVDGGGVRRLTKGSDHFNWAPSWDPSGSRIAFTRFGDPRLKSTVHGVGAQVVELNADGSCPRVIPLPGRVFGMLDASWRRGPGRGAGPISC